MSNDPKVTLYNELVNTLVVALKPTGNVRLQPGRKYDKIYVGDRVEYFVDKNSWVIYGAKSNAQHNTRRQYGDLRTVEQFDWMNSTPKAGTTAEALWNERESEIRKSYKKRGRPRKNPVTTP